MSVYGHWRSGNHYLMALLKLNFGQADFYTTRERSVHSFPGEWVVEDEPVFYTTRNFDDVADSMWRLKERFGVKANSFEEFLGTKYKNMYHDYGKFLVGRDGEVITASSATGVRSIDMTPREYWEKHTQAWNGYGRPHVHHVDYDRLREDFHGEMLKIAAHLGSGRVVFEDIIGAQGWFSL